jgi:hypothetical protein
MWGPGGTIYLCSPGDHPGHTVFDVLANASGYAGTPQNGVGAFENFYNNYPGLQDSMNYPSAGYTRHDLIDSDGGPGDLGTSHWDYQNSNGSNGTSFFEMAPGSDWMATTTISSHNVAAGFALVNKNTGLLGAKAQQTTMVDSLGEDTTGYWQVFGMWGGILINPVDSTTTDLFMMGPGFDKDNPKDGRLGYKSWGDLDDGLRVGCLRVTSRNDRPDDGYPTTIYDRCGGLWSGAATKFNYAYQSTGPAATNKHDHGSYNEQDLLYRNKAMMVVGDGVYIAWKPSQAGNAQLIRATPTVNQTYNLGVGAGRRGQDIWPNISYVDLGADGQYVIYYAANAYYRGADPGNISYWEWPRKAPLGPAELSVFSVGSGSVRWTYNLSTAYPSLPPNDALGYMERSRMLVSGKHAYIAWIDLSGTNCVLRVAQFDITTATAPSVAPAPLGVDLGIPVATNKETYVNDIAAADRMVFVYVIESDTMSGEYYTTPSLHTMNYDWNALRVVAIDSTGGSGGDTTAPTVTLTSAVISGTVSDTFHCPVEVIINGSTTISVKPTGAKTGSWVTGNLGLVSGTNDFAITSTDASSNTRQVNLSITGVP